MSIDRCHRFSFPFFRKRSSDIGEDRRDRDRNIGRNNRTIIENVEYERSIINNVRGENANGINVYPSSKLCIHCTLRNIW